MQQENRRRHLFSTGILLFLLAILFGLIFPKLANPRMGLSGHLVGLFGGLFLLALGSIWKQVNLPPRLEAVPVWLALYGTYGNFVTTVLAATFATNRLTPLAGSGHSASAWQEDIVTLGLVSVSGAMVTCCLFVLWGLRRQLAE